MSRFAGFGLLVLAGAASAQDLPPPIRAARSTDFAACRAAAGEPATSADYATAADLNGDGALDWVVDLAGLDCAGGGDPFCGAAGCPVTVWLSGTGGHLAAWRGRLGGWRIEDGALVVERRGAACPENAETCTGRLAFGEAVADVSPPPARSAAEPEPPPDGWTLRAVPDGAPVALGGGPGAIRSLAVFCLADQPWLAVTLDPAPRADAVELGFAFSDADLTFEARREESAGGAYVVALAENRLAGLLAGRDSEVPVTVSGAAEGVLSLAGSTDAIRGAVERCHTF